MSEKNCSICGMQHPSREELAEQGLNVRMLLTSFPKSGTNIIGQMWTLDGRPPVWIPSGDNHLYYGATYCIREDRFYSDEKVISALNEFTGAAWSHLAYRESFADILLETKTPVFVLIRDPRDVAVSQVFHIHKWPDAGLNFHYPDGTQLKDKDDPIRWIIESMPLRYDQYIGWLSSPKPPNVFLVRYEDLILNLTHTVEEMVAHAHPNAHILGLGSADDWMVRINPAASPTFRHGAIGDWKTTFNTEHIELFNELMDDRMRVLGYEL